MPYYQIHSALAAAHVLYNAQGKAVTVPGRGSVNVDLDERAAARLTHVRGLRVQELDGSDLMRPSKPAGRGPNGERLDRLTQDPFDHDGDGKPGGSLPRGSTVTVPVQKEGGEGGGSGGGGGSLPGDTVIESEKSGEARAALDEYRDGKIEYHEFVSRAKALAGDDWPGGTPKKSIVISLLENMIEG